MPPLSLFLLINLFYFWYSPFTDMNLSLHEQLNQPYRALTQHLVSQKLQNNNMTQAQYEENYNQKSTRYANSLIALHLPVFALFLMLFYFRKNYFNADHVVFAAYVLAFVLLAALFQRAIMMLFLFIKIPTGVAWPIVTTMFVSAILYYLFASLNNVYYLRVWVAAISVVPVLLAFLISHFIYRLFLFLIIYCVT